MRLKILNSGYSFGTKVLFAVIRMASRHPVPDAAKLVFYRTDFYGSPMKKFTHEAMRGQAFWSVGDRELMAAFVSKMNECPFCTGAHSATAAMAYNDEAKVSAVLFDLESATIGEPLRATLRMLGKLTREHTVNAEDMREVLAAGVSREQIEDALAACFAFNDTLRDFLPLTKGLQPTVRVSLLDYTWCELDPNKEEDVELFKSLVLNNDNKSSEKVQIATVCIQSNGYYTNESRTRLLFELIDNLDKKADLILLPAGFYQTSKYPNTSYKSLSKVFGQYLEKLNSNMAICLEIDGRDGLDQMAMLFTKGGLQAIGRKFYPAGDEEIDGADSYLSLEDGYSRLFELRGKKFYIAVCYDVFGIKNEGLNNPGVDVILDLVHRFNPYGEDNSGDVLFARHGFAGASKHWGCPTFGAVVFFDRVIPVNWPTGVLWKCKKKDTRSWGYTDNPLSHYKEFEINLHENAKIRLFEV